MERHQDIEDVFERMSNVAPEILTRKKFQELTGGLVSEKTLANLDSEGGGIYPRLRVGGKVAYPKDAAIAWLKNRCRTF